MTYTRIDKLIDTAAEITVFSNSTLYLLDPDINEFVYRLDRSRPYLWRTREMMSYCISSDSDLFLWEMLTDSREKAVQRIKEWRKEKDDAETERWKSATDEDFLKRYSRVFHEKQSLDEYIDDVHRYLILSSWHYSNEIAWSVVSERIDEIEEFYESKAPIDDAAVEVGYYAG